MPEIELSEEFCDWWQELTEQEQDDCTAVIELLEERGIRLPYPYSSAIRGSKYSHMRELRVQSHGDPIRIVYAFDPRRKAILLTGGLKSGNQSRFYKELIASADKIYDAHLKSLRTRD